MKFKRIGFRHSVPVFNVSGRQTERLTSLDRLIKVAGAEGLEPPTYGFGDRRSTN
jgi:hypothetical protein